VATMNSPEPVEETLIAEHLNQRTRSTTQFLHVRYRRDASSPLCDSFVIRSIKAGRPPRDQSIGYRLVPKLLEAVEMFVARVRDRQQET
jgi:hypothetical protein